MFSRIILPLFLTTAVQGHAAQCFDVSHPSSGQNARLELHARPGGEADILLRLPKGNVRATGVAPAIRTHRGVKCDGDGLCDHPPRTTVTYETGDLRFVKSAVREAPHVVEISWRLEREGVLWRAESVPCDPDG